MCLCQYTSLVNVIVYYNMDIAYVYYKNTWKLVWLVLPGVCPSMDVSVSEWDSEEEMDDSLPAVLLLLLSLTGHWEGKQLSTTASSSDEEDDDAELSSGSELESNSWEIQTLPYSHVIHSEGKMSSKTAVWCIILHIVDPEQAFEHSHHTQNTIH